MRKESLDGDRLFVVHDCLDSAECRDHIARSEREGYGDATITTVRGVMLNKDVRSNARLIVDDTALAARLWDRLHPLIPPTFVTSGCTTSQQPMSTSMRNPQRDASCSPVVISRSRGARRRTSA